jgi:hypothetical protein
MRVRAQVDRHAREIGCKVGPVIEIEAAQKVLVGFPGAAVLRHDHSGYVFQHLARAEQRAIIDELRSDEAGAGGVAGTNAGFIVRDDVDLVERLRLFRAR